MNNNYLNNNYQGTPLYSNGTITPNQSIYNTTNISISQFFKFEKTIY